MIVWNILLSFFLLISLACNVYVFFKGRLNTKAIVEIIGPKLDLVSTEVIKIKKSL